jgi:hypothetical protein
MIYLDFLARVHELLQPRTYLEVGIRKGHSLALSHTRSVGIDPAYEIEVELTAPTDLVQETSDDYFARLPASGPFDGVPVDLAFIDGMHLFEFALRDFINAEKHGTWSSVIAFDDVLPRGPVMANRERATRAWTGDVYKIEQVLREFRRDLAFLTVDTKPTGLLLVFGLDPANRLLADKHDELVSTYVHPDPQNVPAEVIERRVALSPAEALASPVWELIRAQRESTDAASGRAAVRRAVRRLDRGKTGKGNTLWRKAARRLERQPA